MSKIKIELVIAFSKEENVKKSLARRAVPIIVGTTR